MITFAFIDLQSSARIDVRDQSEAIMKRGQKPDFTDKCPIDIVLNGADYSIFGADFYEEVPIVRECGGRIFWLNRDWFHSHAVDVSTIATRRKVERWLLNSFSVRTALGTRTDEVAARADRYGGLSGTAHGGSGRCVYRGRFNIKGVGRTPLVPEGLSSHTDGRYLLIEAIRGAIYSELAHYESLAGTIRTIAIIQIPPYSVPPEDRRCLIVRENFVRPAHFERSLIFGTAGFEGSDQSKDHKRVQAVRRVLLDQGLAWDSVVANLARQIGSLDAMRMSQGRFTSSNMALDGKVADFETFRIFDSWYFKKQINRDDLVFAKELELLGKSATRWTKLLSVDRKVDVRAFCLEHHRRGFMELVEILVGDESSPDKRRSFAEFLFSTFVAHSKRSMADQNDWIVSPDISAHEFVDKMLCLTNSFGFTDAESVLIASRMNAWRLSRSEITLSNVNAFAAEIIEQSGSPALDPREAIDCMIWKNRRVFRYGMRGLAPVCTTYQNESYSLYVVDVINRSAYELRWRRGLGGPSGGANPDIHPLSKLEIYGVLHGKAGEHGSRVVQIYNEWLAKYLV